MIKYFVVSDVHSFYIDMLDALHIKGFEDSNSKHKVIMCGDAFDRGAESVNLFNWMKNMSNQGRLIYIRGNHEDLMFDLINDYNSTVNISGHHVSNGTVKTLADLTGCTSFDILYRFANKEKIEKTSKELLEFIDTYSQDYFILDKTVFTHGWVPTTSDDNGYMIVHKNWRDGGWAEARWENGMEMHHFGAFPEDMDTVVCGHWHTSFGWHNYEHKGSEFNDDAIFDPYIKTINDKTIVAIDACTAYTRQVNCVVFDEYGKIINK